MVVIVVHRQDVVHQGAVHQDVVHQDVVHQDVVDVVDVVVNIFFCQQDYFYKRGVVIKKQTIWVDGQNGEPVQRSKWLPDYNIPIFTQEKEYLYNLIPVIQITEDNIA